MEAWGWIGVYLVGFVAFQLLLFRYFAGDRAFGDPTPESSELPTPNGADRQAPVPASGRQPEAEACCPHCGVPNADDGTYTYCRRCLGRLE